MTEIVPTDSVARSFFQGNFMSPNPYNRNKTSNETSGGSLPNRLNLLLFLMVVQIVLTIILLIKLPDATEHQSPVVVENEAQERSGSVLNDLPSRQEQNVPVEVSEPTSVSGETDAPNDPVAIEPVRVQVLNGCGVRGLAAKIEGQLERNGYDVCDVGNADREYRNSLVIIRSDDPTDAQAVAALLGITASNIQPLTGLPMADFNVTVIIGKDYQRLTFDR